MAEQAFLSGYSLNPEDARIRISPQDATTVSGNNVYPNPPDPTNYTQSHYNGQGLLLSQGQIEDMVLSPSGSPLGNLAGKRMIGGGPIQIGTVDPSNPLFIHALAGVYGTYAFNDTATTNVSRWKFSLEETADDGGGEVVDEFTVQENNQVFLPVRASGLRFTTYSVTAAGGGPLQAEFGFLTDRYDLFGDVSQETGSGSTKPVAIGTFSGNFASSSTDKDIWVRFDNDSSPYTVSTKLGASAAYSNTQTLTEGEWLRLQDESGDPIGAFKDQPRLYIASGATISTNDEFKIPRRHTGWSTSLGSRNPISSVNARVFVNPLSAHGGSYDGAFEIPATDISIATEWSDVSSTDHVPTSQGKDIHIGGELQTTVNLSRRARGLLFQKGIHEGDLLAFILDVKSDTEIASTGKYFRYLRVLPECLVTGEMFQVPSGGGGTVDESPVLFAQDPGQTLSYDGQNYSAHDTTELNNENSDYTALVAA